MHVLYSQKNYPLWQFYIRHFPNPSPGRKKKTYGENNTARSIPFLLKFEIIEKKINAELTFTLKRLEALLAENDTWGRALQFPLRILKHLTYYAEHIYSQTYH